MILCLHQQNLSSGAGAEFCLHSVSSVKKGQLVLSRTRRLGGRCTNDEVSGCWAKEATLDPVSHYFCS